MYYRGPSRLLWFAFGALATTWYHRAHARGEFRGWGPCGNRRIEEWRAERATETAMKERFPSNTTTQQKNEAVGEWSWRPAAPSSPEDEEVRRRWEDKARNAQQTVCVSSDFHPAGGFLPRTFKIQVADLSESALDGILVAAESLKAVSRICILIGPDG